MHSLSVARHSAVRGAITCGSAALALPLASAAHQPGSSSSSTSRRYRHGQKATTPRAIHSNAVSTAAASSFPRRSFSSSGDAATAAPAALSPDATPLSLYAEALQAGTLREDARQRATVQMLENTFQALLQAQARGGFKPPPTLLHRAHPTAVEPPSSGGLLGFAKKILASKPASQPSPLSPSGPASPFVGVKGLYLHGGVGCGKTMLMNQFFECVQARVTRQATRAHFHSFMLDIHRRLHLLRTSNPSITDPVAMVARQLVREGGCHVLALDEFQVTDVADAMILKQLFGVMWAEGCVLVATSNRPPEDLYWNGLNRPVFLPFITSLRDKCVVHAMEEGQDHRLLGTLAQGVYHSPVDAQTRAKMAETFDRLAGTDAESRGPATVRVMSGRALSVPLASRNGLVAQFSFVELCESALGAADYLALVSTYKYILLTDVPVMYFHQREKIRRFITFLDVAYEHATRVIFQAEAAPTELFRSPTAEQLSGGQSSSVADGAAPEFEGVGKQPNGASSSAAAPSSSSPSPSSAGATATVTGAKYDEQFASSRAVSRLVEMSSVEYMKACAKARDQGNAQGGQAAEGDTTRTQQYLESEKQQTKAAM